MTTPGFIDFPHAAQIIRIHRSQTPLTHPEEGSAEFVYAITSLPRNKAKPGQLAELLRGHWGIENRLNWVRDTAYQEDASQVRTGAGAHMMASLRNLAISCHRLAGHPNISATTRHYQRHPEQAAELTGLCKGPGPLDGGGRRLHVLVTRSAINSLIRRPVCAVKACVVLSRRPVHVSVPIVSSNA